MAISTPSLHETMGLSIQVYEPVPPNLPSLSATQRAQPLVRLTNKINSYSHGISAFGGYTDASIGFGASESEVEDWYENGVGRRVVSNDEAGVIVWEGFVNKLTITLGGLSLTRGPLMDVANLVACVYTSMRYNTNPPIGGQEAVTPTAQDLPSQEQYGFLFKKVSAGMMRTDQAFVVRDTFLEDNRQPQTTQQLDIGSGNDPTVTLECLGYYYWLEQYEYESPATGNLSATAKITAVIAGDPNAIILPTTEFLSTNLTPVQAYEHEHRDGLTIIKDAVSRGEETTGRRWLFGVYAGRKPYYVAAPQTVEYSHQLRDRVQKIVTHPAGDLVRPWNMLPGKWLRVNGFLVGKAPTNSLSDDPRCIFIEQVKYTAPWGLSIMGGKNRSLVRRLATTYALASMV